MTAPSVLPRTDSSDRQPPVVDALLALATRMFAERGYEGTSIRDLSQAAGFSVAVVYHHFRSKEDLYEVVCEQRFDDCYANFTEQLQRLPPASRTASAIALILYDLLVGDRELYYLVHRNLVNVTPEHKSLRAHACYLKLRRRINETLAATAQAADGDTLMLALDWVITGCIVLVLASSPPPGPERDAHLRHHREHLRRFMQRTYETSR